MKHALVIVPLLVFFILGISLPVTGCRYITDSAPEKQTATASTPTVNTLVATSSIPVKKLVVTVEPCLGDSEGDISFENVTAKKCILDRDYSYFSSAVKHGAGDPCFLISGNISNRSDKRYWVAVFAVSIDDMSYTGPRTLDSGPIIGIAQIGIEGKSSESFTLHLSWSENASSFKVFSAKSAIMFP
jgi:hypothetical protein